MGTAATIEPSIHHALQLKSDILDIIAKIKDEQELSEIYDYLHAYINDDGDELNLTPEQEAELDLAIAETYDPSKLIPHEEAIRMMKSW